MGQVDPERMFPETPPGWQLPIPCRYPFGPGSNEERFMVLGMQPPHYKDKLPEGFSVEWLEASDPRIEEAGFHVAAMWVNEETQIASFEQESGTKPVSYMYLLDQHDNLVATWDEGRWWTPDESNQFQFYLKVPGAVLVGKRSEFGMGRSAKGMTEISYGQEGEGGQGLWDSE